MNKQRMLLLADLLDSIKPEKFNLTYWASNVKHDPIDDHYSYFCQDGEYVDLSVYNCNTAGCVAGWAVALKNDLNVVLTDDGADGIKIFNVESQAREYLDLTHDESTSLFYYGCNSIWSKYSEELGLDDTEIGYDNAVKSHHAALLIRYIAEGKWSF